MSKFYDYTETIGHFKSECPICNRKMTGSKVPYHPDKLLFYCEKCDKFFTNEDVDKYEWVAVDKMACFL